MKGSELQFEKHIQPGNLDEGGLQGCDCHQSMTLKDQRDWKDENKKREQGIR